MIAKLLLLSQEDQSRQEIVLDKPRITIGRKPGNELHFNRPEISGIHAAFTFEDGKYFVMDLGSTNGTLLNGAELLANQKYALQPNDVVTVAPFRITFVLEEEMMETMIEIPGSQKNAPPKAGSGMVSPPPPVKISTGTQEREMKKRVPPQEEKEPEKQVVEESVPEPPPPAVEPPPPEPKPAPPPPQQESSEPEVIPVRKQSTFMDYIWIGLGVLVFLAAIALILLLALTI